MSCCDRPADDDMKLLLPPAMPTPLALAASSADDVDALIATEPAARDVDASAGSGAPPLRPPLRLCGMVGANGSTPKRSSELYENDIGYQ